MIDQAQLRVVRAEAIDLAPDVRAALALLAEDRDGETCFVLTGDGVFRARANPADPTTFHLCDGNPPPSFAAGLAPRWNRERRVLTYGGQIVKRFVRSSPNQEAVLQAFEDRRWPNQIEDPLPWIGKAVVKSRLHDTIKWLNRNLESRVLRFHGDGTGERVCWESVAIGALVLHGNGPEQLRPAA